ncbi:MAG: toprim domain-containing protein [Bacteroidota bacterium]
MNSEQAKKLNLPHILSKLGYEAIKITKNGNEYWYNSPFRAEKAASFHTSFLGGKWIWNDFGDKGGTVIDFVMRYKNYHSVKDALNYLEQFESVRSKSQNHLFSFQQQAFDLQNSQLELIKATSIEHPAILNYLTQERKLDVEAVQSNLVEVHYKNQSNHKHYFAFGIKNRANGYEIRSASDQIVFKSVIGKKDISLITPSTQPTQLSKSLFIFEGMLDYLSLLSQPKKLPLCQDYLMMHSTSNLENTLAYLSKHTYEQIHTFLDNDEAGKSTTKALQAKFGRLVSNQSFRFAPHKDLNEALKKGGFISLDMPLN